MVFDHSGRYLYISTSDGFVKRYNLATNQIDNSYNLGGSLNGLDIAPDDSFLIIAQNNTSNGQGTFHKLDVTTGAVTNINYTIDTNVSEGGGWDVAIASNGLAIVTLGDIRPHLRQIDLATNTITIRNDGPGAGGLIDGETKLYRSADRTRLYLWNASSTTAVLCTYDSLTNTVGQPVSVQRYLSAAGGAVNRNGTLLASRFWWSRTRGQAASIDTPSFRYVRSLANLDGGVAFDAAKDLFYAVSGATGEIIAYDTNTWAESFRLAIGENIGDSRGNFDTGNIVASQNGNYLALETPTGIRVISVPNPVPTPTVTPAPTLATRRDMVFDHSGTYIYVATATGQVLRYNISTHAIDAAYDLGGSLNGIDIAVDDSFLLVAQDLPGIGEGAVHKIDLNKKAMSNITYPLTLSDALGSWDVAIGANGIALFSTYGLFRQIDLSSNSVSSRTDSHVSGLTQIHRSADSSRMYLLQPGVSNGPVVTYNASTNDFTPSLPTNTFTDTATGAVNRDGTLLATRIDNHASVDTRADYGYRHSFSGIDSGVAFDGAADRFYVVNRASGQVIAYNTNNFAELFRLEINESLPAFAQFDSGTLVASPDGKHLALATPTTVRLFTIPDPLPSPTPTPSPTLGTPRDMVFNQAGNYLYIATAEGQVQRYNIQTNALDASYNVGGLLNGIDITPDDSSLLVAQGTSGLTQGAIERINLQTGAVTAFVYPLADYENGAWDVAIGASGLALFTAQEGGFGWLPVRQLDLATNTVSTRTDTRGTGRNGWITSGTHIRRSADRNRFYFSDNPVFTYNALTNTFEAGLGPSLPPSRSWMAVNRNGTLAATRSGKDVVMQSLPGFGSVHTFSAFDGDPSYPYYQSVVSGVAFDAAKDLLYAVHTFSNEIFVYDTNTFAEKHRFALGENIDPSAPRFGVGNLTTSQDGRWLGLITPTAIRLYDVANDGAPPPPQMLSPTPGSTLTSSSVTFSWSAGNATAYALLVGSSQGGSNIYNSGAIYTFSAKATNVPTDGRKLYVTLGYQVNGSWVYNRYTYTAFNASASPTPTPTPSPTPTATPTATATPSPTPTPTASPTPTSTPTVTPTPTPGTGAAVMLSPSPGSTFNSSSVTFNWSAGSATAYALLVGSSQNGSDVYNSGQVTVRSATVNNIPTDGRTIYVALYSKVNNSWVSKNYTYKAFNSSGSPTPTPTPTPSATPTPTPSVTPTPTATPTPTPTATPTPTITPTPTPGSGAAVMLSPTPGSTFTSSSVTFTWSAGSATVYALLVGSSQNSTDIYNSGQTTSRSVTVNNIPTDGRTIYVSLFSKVNNSWVANNYTYKAFK